MSWRLAHSIEILRQEMNQLAPHRSTASDGTIGDAQHATRDSDHNPWVIDNLGRGVVTAIDITHDPKHGADMDVLAIVLATVRDPRIKYIIRNKRICRSYDKPNLPAWTWAPYTGTNPHEKHMHISVNSEQTLYDDIRTWQLTDGKEEDMIPAILLQVQGKDPVWCVTAQGRWHVPSEQVLNGLRFFALVRPIDNTANDVIVLPADQEGFLLGIPMLDIPQSILNYNLTGVITPVQ